MVLYFSKQSGFLLTGSLQAGSDLDAAHKEVDTVGLTEDTKTV
jgi:hypothetical protein